MWTLNRYSYSETGYELVMKPGLLTYRIMCASILNFHAGKVLSSVIRCSTARIWTCKNITNFSERMLNHVQGTIWYACFRMMVLHPRVDITSVTSAHVCFVFLTYTVLWFSCVSPTAMYKATRTVGASSIPMSTTSHEIKQILFSNGFDEVYPTTKVYARTHRYWWFNVYGLNL